MADPEVFTSTGPSITDPYPVYTGIWTNWSHGKIMGATLTLTRQDADLLIAFTAFFIAFISTRTWRILCFCFHRLFSTSTPQDIIYHQRQAILRNSSSPENSIYLFWQLLWVVRHSKRFLRVLPIIVTAVACIAAFTLAGGFSSRLSTGVGNEVLISSANCGAAYPPTSSEDINIFYAFQPYCAKKITDAVNYVQRCYTVNVGADCSSFVTPRLQSKQDFNASCPFTEPMCRSQSGNLRLDSGYVDSHKHLGLNSPAGQRISWRHVVHCAPLVTEGFTSQEDNYQAFTRYHYGNFTALDGEVDYMYKAPSLEFQYSDVLSEDYSVTQSTHKVQAWSVYQKDYITYTASSDFEPIAPITRHDADTTVIFLSGNGVLYTNSGPDDWYRVSTSPVNGSAQTAHEVTEWSAYLPSEPASPLGCAVQHQFCNSAFGDSGCGPLSSLRDAIAGVASLFDADYTLINAGHKDGTAKPETASINYFTWMFFGFDKTINQVFNKLGPAALLSQQALIGTQQGPLAPNQWQQDITYAWNISLALIQGSIVNVAYGPTDPNYLPSWIKFTSPSLLRLCNNQKILSTTHGSFSLVGLFSIFITGFLIALTSFLLEPVSLFLCKKGYRQYAHLEWTINAVLQLQRLAHEELGLGTWSGCADTVPTTKAAEVMASLNITNIKHPVFDQPGKQECSKTDQGLRASVTAEDSSVSADPTHSEGLTPSAPNGVSDVTPAQTPEPQDHGPGVASQEAGCMEGGQLDEIDDGASEVGTNRLRWEEGSPFMHHDTNAETEATTPRYAFQSESGEPPAMDSAVAVPAATAAHSENLTSSSRPVNESDAY